MILRGLSIIILLMSTFFSVAIHADPKLIGSELIKSQFALVDHNAKPVTEKSYYGKYTLIFFGFTHCPKICPLGLNTIASVLKKLGSKSAKIAPIFISIDPKRDDVKRMSEYIKNFDPRMIGLTGTQEQVDQVTKSFRAYYSKIKDKDAESYSFDHSAVIYLMDRRGGYLMHFSSSQNTDEIAEKIKKILVD